MVSADVQTLLAIAGSFVLTALAVWGVWRQGSKAWKAIDKNQPLILKAGTRSEEAAKIVDQGTTTCAHCSFVNFQYLIFCAVCAKPLSSTKKIKGQPTTNSSRAERAQRRGEWLRKSDVEGKFFWFRGPVATTTATGAPQPGFVFHFATPSDSTSTALDQQVLVKWSDPTSSDALVFATGSSLLSATATAMSTVTTQPFPTKYTEFVNRTSALAQPGNKLRLRFKNTDPDAVYLEIMTQLAVLDLGDLHAQFIVNYTDTSTLNGAYTTRIDWHRDWLSMMTKKLADPASGLFTCVNEVDQTYYINSDSHAVLGDEHLNFFYAAGRLVGRALVQGDLIEFHLATPLLKILLGLPVSFHDLEHFDPVTYKNLKFLVENSNVESLDLDFSVQEKRNGEVVTVNLIPNGRNVPVTDANKLEYLNRKTQYVLVESVAPQLHALCKGFYEVVPQELLLIFDPEELDYVLCGSDEIDVDEWERESRYGMGLYDHGAKRWFWRMVREMPEDYKRRLLHYATGSTRVPVGGFKALKSWDGRIAPFTLESCLLVDGQILTATPCFNRVTLPLHWEKKKLKAMLYAVLDPETYPLLVKL